MKGFSSDVLQPGVRWREVLGWALYDFANSGYTTVVLTAVYAAYFVSSIAGAAAWATLAWTSALSLSALLVMVTAPRLGAMADRRGSKKRFLAFSTLACVVFTAALAWTPGVGGTAGVVLAMLLVVGSNAAYCYGESLIAAFLPELARPEAVGRVSGWGWALGYLGGMLTLGICLAYVLWAQVQGQPAAHFVAVTMLLTAAVFGLASLGTFVWLRERPVARPLACPAAGPDTGAGGDQGRLASVRQSWRAVREYRDFRWLLAATVAYQGGVAVAITLAAIYAEQAIGFEPQETMFMIFALNLAAALGAVAFGHVQDWLGHKRALVITLLGWILTCVLAAAATGKPLFWVAATLAGLSMGSSQSAGRAMAALLAPPARMAEFFGLWTLAVRLASIIGPMMYGLIVWGSGGNQRLAILATALLFVAGLACLRPLDMARGRRLAAAA
ncbi:MFS transporter [Kerstersia sp.]|uniref:MFS transporter n=1 Tax=Kerstersia sp. TaxID=1930783 RepID=UPI003F90DE9A